jgi:hypothetical protein
MSKQQQSRQDKDKSRYYPPEMIPFALCSACLDVVLEQSEKAAEIYEEVIECLSLPGCQETMDQIVEWLPDNRSIIKALVKESGYDVKKPPDKEGFGIPYVRGLMKGGLGLLKGYANKLTPRILKGKRRKRDLTLLVNKIDEFIKVGFNSKTDQLNGKYKITIAASSFLFNTIWISVLSENYRQLLKQWEKVKVIQYCGKTYDMADVINDKVTASLYRYLHKQYKNAGFRLRHDQKLDNIALRWYQSRVVYSGPEEYCRKLLLEEGEDLDPANVSNEIKECDEAIGYPRGNKPKSDTWDFMDVKETILGSEKLYKLVDTVRMKLKK